MSKTECGAIPQIEITRRFVLKHDKVEIEELGLKDGQSMTGPFCGPPRQFEPFWCGNKRTSRVLKVSKTGNQFTTLYSIFEWKFI